MNNFMQPFRAAGNVVAKQYLLYAAPPIGFERARWTRLARCRERVSTAALRRIGSDGGSIGLTNCEPIKQSVKGATINDAVLARRRRAAQIPLRTRRVAERVIDCDGADQCAHGR